jgi:hypothetical protein
MTIAQHQQRSRQSTIIVFVLLALAASRFIMGEFLRYYFISSAGYDDQLLLTYSHIKNHFRNPDYLSLVKTMSFPLFLNLIDKLHISFSQAISLVWIAAAFLFYRLIQYLFRNRVFSYIAFAYILFHPVAYSAAAGLRIYRNTLIAPFVMMTFCELLMLFFHLINEDERFRVQILRSVIFSILLLFTYFLKEDGVWISACTCFFILLLLLVIIVRSFKKQTMKKRALSAAVCAVLPLVIFFAGKQAYKAINYQYFQVAEIQTRTEGELGKFVSNAYKIESPEQNYQYTVPASSIKEMYRVSPTFQNDPELMNSILHSSLYGGDIEKNPIQGDFLTWVLRSALIETNTWKSEKQVSDLFAQINAEVERAFENGQLQQNHKIRLLSSAVGRTPKEVTSLFPYVWESFVDSLTLKNYSVEISGAGTTNNAPAAEDAAALTGLPYLIDYSFTETSSYSHMVQFFNGIIWIYRVLNPALIAFALYSLIVTMRTRHRSAKRNHPDSSCLHRMIPFTAICFLGICWMYSFGISWFAQFLMPDPATAYIVFNFYATALIPLSAIALFLFSGMVFQIRRGTTTGYASGSCRTVADPLNAD